MRRNRQIILMLNTASPYHRKILQGIGNYVHEKRQWDLHLVHDSPESQLYLKDDPLESATDLGASRVDGIIAAFLNRRITASLRRSKSPVVGIEAEYGWCDPHSPIPYFATDNQAIGRLGATELIERGFKRLAFCGIPRMRYSGWSEQRQVAFAERAREANVPCSIFANELGGGEKSPLPKRLRAWLKSLPKPVGLMACYDVRARHVLAACRGLDIPVPEDVAVIGVDNDELICELTSPPLSSIEQGARTIGYQAAALLDRLMAGRRAAQLKHVVEPEGVVTRRSSDMLDIADADVAAAMRFIRQHACAGIRVSDVVRALAISWSSLGTRFKAVMGRTILAEIQRVQLERARQLLVATNLPLKEVAAEAGFAYVQHLTTLFCRYAGQTPGEYRHRSRA